MVIDGATILIDGATRREQTTILERVCKHWLSLGACAASSSLRAHNYDTRMAYRMMDDVTTLPSCTILEIIMLGNQVGATPLCSFVKATAALDCLDAVESLLVTTTPGFRLSSV